MSKSTSARLAEDGEYEVDGRRYTRLSHVVEGTKHNEGLDQWRKRVGKEEADRVVGEAADYGTCVHEMTMFHDREEWPALDQTLGGNPWLAPHYASYVDWKKEYVVRFILVETIVWSTKMRVAGTIDRTAIMKGDKKPSIVDLKTGSLSDEVGVRLAGYRLMHNERCKAWGMKPVDRIIALHMPRKNPGHIKAKDYTDRVELYEREFKERAKEYNRTIGR